jgi:hypothetical protein
MKTNLKNWKFFNLVNFNLLIMSTKYSKDLFERYGDDFCELILSYFLIAHKGWIWMRSKQLQRLIFNKQFSLLIKVFNDENNFDTIDKLWIKKSYYFFRLNNVWFETVFKKCELITHLEIKRNYGLVINLEDGNFIHSIWLNE